LLRATLTSLTHTPRCIQQSFGTVGRFRMQSSMPGLRPDRMISFFLFMSQISEMIWSPLPVAEAVVRTPSVILCPAAFISCFHLAIAPCHARLLIGLFGGRPFLVVVLDRGSVLPNSFYAYSPVASGLPSPLPFPFSLSDPIPPHPLILSLTYACRDWRWLWPSADRICGPTDAVL
jgi:hypothetical protein